MADCINAEDFNPNCPPSPVFIMGSACGDSTGDTCDNPTFVQICNTELFPVGIEQGIAPVGCVKNASGAVTGKVFLSKTVPEDQSSPPVFEYILANTNGTIVNPYTGGWVDCEGDGQKVRECVKLRLAVVSYDNSQTSATGGECGDTSSPWMVAINAATPAVYTNWSAYWADQNIIPAANSTFTVTSAGAVGLDQHFTLTTPVLNAVNPGEGTWNWYNSGPPCARIWSLVTDYENGIKWGRWTVTVTRGGKAVDILMSPAIIETPEIYLYRVDCGTCANPDISFEDVHGNKITNWYTYLSGITGIPAAQIQNSLTQAEILSLIKQCDYTYIADYPEQTTCTVYVSRLCDIKPGSTPIVFYRTLSQCVTGDIVETTIEDTVEDPRVTAPEDLTAYQVQYTVTPCGQVVSSETQCDTTGKRWTIVTYDDGTIVFLDAAGVEGIPTGTLSECDPLITTCVDPDSGKEYLAQRVVLCEFPPVVVKTEVCFGSMGIIHQGWLYESIDPVTLDVINAVVRDRDGIKHLAYTIVDCSC